MPTQSQTTQDFVPIREIRDGIVILKDGSMRALVLASSLNFALKSADEQNAIILQFQNFLNSLDFSVQIFIQSKKLDIRPYIALLEERYKEQMTELMKIQTREYIEFIRTFVENSNIMTKSFFLVVPYMPPMISASKNPMTKIVNKFSDKSSSSNANKIGIANAEFDEYRSQIEQRVSVVEQGLVRCGIRVAELGTEEVVELYYKIFNPGESEKPIQIN